MDNERNRRRFEEIRNFWTECDELTLHEDKSTCEERRRIAKEMYRTMVEDYRNILQENKDLREAAASEIRWQLVRTPFRETADP